VQHRDFGIWKNEFQRNDISIVTGKLSDAKQLLVRTLIETRFSLQDLDLLFLTFSKDRGLPEEDAALVWDAVSILVQDNIVRGTERKNIDSSISSALAGLRLRTSLDIVAIVSDFRHLCLKLINLATQYNPSNTRHIIGVLGEILAFLYTRDISCCDCIHHKLVPDAIMAFRHGMDLLAVKFSQSYIDDEVHFIEAKATTSRFSAQRDEVIEWFNITLTSKANTMIDQAKRSWRGNYPEDKFKRASRALCRFQIYVEEIAKSPAHYIGSILINNDQEPTENEILGFNKIQYPKKQLIIIKAPCIVDLSKEIFDLACKT
jgi:hypothetical protein